MVYYTRIQHNIITLGPSTPASLCILHNADIPILHLAPYLSYYCIHCSDFELFLTSGCKKAKIRSYSTDWRWRIWCCGGSRRTARYSGPTNCWAWDSAHAVQVAIELQNTISLYRHMCVVHRFNLFASSFYSIQYFVPGVYAHAQMRIYTFAHSCIVSRQQSLLLYLSTRGGVNHFYSSSGMSYLPSHVHVLPLNPLNC